MTEDEVLRDIQQLVAAGEYLDSMLGVPARHRLNVRTERRSGT